MKASGNHIQLKKSWATFRVAKISRILILPILILPFTTYGQQAITLNKCLGLATENYPLVKQSVLLNDQSRFDIEAINTGRLPKLEVNAQATYQSDVTSLPIQLPNTTIEPPNKDQYRATLDVNQLVYNGGLIDASAKVAEAKAKVSAQEIEVTLHEVKNQVVQLYLSILLKQENRALLEAKEKQLQTRLDEARAGVKFGLLLPSSSHSLEVELLRIKQNYVEIDYAKLDLIQRLSLLTGTELGKNSELQRPTVSLEPNTASKRPELVLFDLQKEQVELSTVLFSKLNLPKLNAFAQGGYGNPGLNMLDNSFNPFYMAGLRLNWNVFDWKKNKTEIQSLLVNKEIIDTQKETFELNNQLELVNLRSEIAKMEELISYDEAIIPLREEMVKTAESQLKNGIITSSDYITEFTNLYEAKSNMTLHKTQLLLKQIQYQLTDGTYGKSDALN